MLDNANTIADADGDYWDRTRPDLDVYTLRNDPDLILSLDTIAATFGPVVAVA